ncbi:alpha-2B adrenergic receptor-like [Paramacrobiotus metropolitanus]|uniref:alpha-2B adrenergic receptor-like n=1 Tax=Paramacrobiotus metropolitanus TaxID=2943436 RepID=UPI00244584DE|nr:alpha-2B adrenergic receptor-like [Paramacrobiotus metropolitanus]
MVLGRVHLSRLQSGNQSSNDTSVLLVATGLPLPAVTLFLTADAAAVLGNGLIFLLFLFNRALMSPFNLYLVNLLSANLLYYSLNFPQHLFNYVLHTWYGHTTGCSVQLALLWTSGSVIRFAHAAITLNRVWALLAPLSYRQQHGYRVARLLCAATWMLAGVLTVPANILDHLYYRLPPAEFGCTTSLAERPVQDALIATSVLTTVALVVIVAAYPGSGGSAGSGTARGWTPIPARRRGARRRPAAVS